MNISKTGKNKTRCCSPELIAAFLDRTLSAEDDERVLIHLSECQDCRDAAAFTGEAIALHAAGTPELSVDERESSQQSVRKLLQKHAKPMDKILWDYCISNTKILSFLRFEQPEPEVLAASGEKNILYFRAQTAETSDYFWTAALEIEDGTEELLRITVTGKNGKYISAGDFELCRIKSAVKNGICFIDRMKLAENINTGGVSFQFEDGTVVKGQPVLGTLA